MISRIYQGAEGFEFIQALSLILFFLVFLGAIIMIFTLRKGYIEKMSNMPLDTERHTSKNNGGLL